MIIKSPFKDYYDWVAHRYGGGDPKIVYARDRLVPLPARGQEAKPLVVEAPSLQLPSLGSWNYHTKSKELMYLVIAGRLYLISKPLPSYKDDINDFTLEPLVDEEDEKRPRWRRLRPRDLELGKERRDLIQLSQQIGHPVFAIKQIQHDRKGHAEAVIPGQCPILQNIGLPALIPAEQMYQDLAYFVGNLMHKTPDIRPPVELSNRQKIVKAGFDLIQSFRHRKG